MVNWTASPAWPAAVYGLVSEEALAALRGRPQRFSTIMSADQILVLEDGEAVGLGRHEELIKTCPTYAEIVESQVGEGVPA